MPALTFTDILDLWKSTTEESYHRPILDAGDGFGLEVVTQGINVDAIVSEAIEQTLQTMYVLPHSSQTYPQAHGEAKATCTLSFSRTMHIDLPLILRKGQLVEQIDTDWSPSGGVQVQTGRRYKILADVIFNVGESGPKTVSAEAEYAGDGFNLRVLGTITGLVYSGAGFNGRLASVSVVAAGPLTSGTSELKIIAKKANDVFSPDHAGQYLKFVDGTNIGKIVRIDSYASPGASDGGTVKLDTLLQIRTSASTPSAAVIATGTSVQLQTAGSVVTIEGKLIAQYVNGSSYYWLIRVKTYNPSTYSTVTKLVDPAQPTVSWPLTSMEYEVMSVVADTYSAWKVLDWVDDFGLTCVDTVLPTGGKFAILDAHGDDKRVYRQLGEVDDDYAQRVATLADNISPAALKRKLTAIWEPTGKTARLVETESTDFPGMFLDVDALDRASPFDESDDYKILVDERTMRGYFIAEVPRVSTGDFGLVLDGDGAMSALDGSAALDGFSPVAKSLYKRTYAAMDAARAGGVDFDLRLPPQDVDTFKWTPKDITSAAVRWLRADLYVTKSDVPFDSGGATASPKFAHGVFLAGWLDAKDGVTAHSINLGVAGHITVEEGVAPGNHAAIHFLGDGGYTFIDTQATPTSYDFWLIVQVLGSEESGVNAYEAGAILSGFNLAGDFGVVVHPDGTLTQFNNDGAVDSQDLYSLIGKWVKIRARFAVPTLYLSVNDSVEVTVATGVNVTADPLAAMGIEFNSGHRVDMRVAEIVCVAQTITDDEKANLQRYFKLRYGL